jgi:hypothetical protein
LGIEIEGLSESLFDARTAPDHDENISNRSTGSTVLVAGIYIGRTNLPF